MCLGSGFGCTPPIPAGVCGVGVGALARVAAAPHHSWRRCWGVFVFGCALRFYPATPGWNVRCGCVCLGLGFGCAPPLLGGVLAVFVFVGALRLYPATPGWDVRCGCVCLGLGCSCAPPSLAGVLGVFVFVGMLYVYPATPCWGVRCGCVCLGSGMGRAPPLLAGVLGGVCVCCPVPLVPRHSWLGCAVWVC